MEKDVFVPQPSLCSCLGLETPQPKGESLRHVLGAPLGIPCIPGMFIELR